MTTDRASLRIAVDIGGTFTDLVLEQGDRVVDTAKVPDDYAITSTPPSRRE